MINKLASNGETILNQSKVPNTGSTQMPHPPFCPLIMRSVSLKALLSDCCQKIEYSKGSGIYIKKIQNAFYEKKYFTSYQVI